MAKVIELRPGIAKRSFEPWVPLTEGRGSFCHRHFSYLCGTGFGRCQEED